MTWEAVAESLKESKAIVWDGCHKIYLAMDDNAVATFRSYGYDNEPSQLVTGLSVEDALATLHQWWDASCNLRFVSAVRTTDANPNDGFTSLIEQFAEDNDEEVEALQ